MNQKETISLSAGQSVWLIGIKGTGMCALAEVLQARGLDVSGSDVPEEFYTDAVLTERGIPFCRGFSAANLPDRIDFAVRSAAYGEDHPEVAAVRERGIPLLVYPEALGLLSEGISAGAVAGVHGKTTTSAITGCLVQALELEGSVLVGSAVPAFGNRSTLIQGSRFLLAETCEYRRHFLHFHPDRMILTSVEADHLDYFRDYEDIRDAFCEFIDRLPEGGTLIWCADDPGTAETAALMKERRPDLNFQPYGFTAEGPWRIRKDAASRPGENRFTLDGWDRTFRLRMPGDHVIQDAAAALALVADQMAAEGRPVGTEDVEKLVLGLYNFTGSRRRSEIIGEAGGVLVMDDYGHHPSAIRKTLEGIRAFYPDRRIIADFMSHTYSRTAALLEDFSRSFGAADLVILHKIYASAREQYNGSVTGRDLFDETSRHHREVRFFEEPAEALPFLKETVRPGDLFITIGAGDNWQLGRSLYTVLTKETD